MKLGLLIAAEKTLQEISAKVEIDGVRTYRLRKIIGKINAELKDYQSTRNDFINEKSKDNRLMPGRDDKALAELNTLIAKLMKEDIDLEIVPVLRIEDFTKISVNTLTLLEELGILECPESKRKQPVAVKKRKTTKKTDGKK